MKTGNTRSPSRHPAATPGVTGRPGRLSKYIASGVLTALVLAVFLTPGLQAPPPAKAQTNNMATGVPGIVDQANPNDSLTTLRPGMTLIAETTGIEDGDGITMVNWMYEWAYWDTSTETAADITGATANTYLLEDKDIDKAMVVKVSFTDDMSNPEGPLRSPPSRIVGPRNLIVKNTDRDTLFDLSLPISGTTTKFAQSFLSSSSASTFDLDFIEFTFGNIGDTATVGNGITVTLNADSSGSPAAALCTLVNPATFSTSGKHNFHAPTAGISTLCPQLEASTTYHVVIEKDSSYTDGITLIHTGAGGTDGGSAGGWTIPDPGQYYSSSTWAENAVEAPMLIDVRARLTEFELEELTETEVPLTWSLLPSDLTRRQQVPAAVPHRPPRSQPPTTLTSTTSSCRPRPPADSSPSRNTQPSSGCWAAPPVMTPATTPRRPTRL